MARQTLATLNARIEQLTHLIANRDEALIAAQAKLATASEANTFLMGRVAHQDAKLALCEAWFTKYKTLRALSPVTQPVTTPVVVSDKPVKLPTTVVRNGITYTKTLSIVRGVYTARYVPVVAPKTE